jgi:6-phosphofructokinase 1
MRIGVLTGGGDAPGLNAAIRAVTRKAMAENDQVIGIKNGWLGLLEGDTMELNLETTRGILPRGGTMLGTSRTNPFKHEKGPEQIQKNMEKFKIDALIPIGGEDTLGAALKLSQLGIPIVGIPKTIDNDIPGSTYALGFDTAVNEVMEALDKLHPTAESHHRVMVVEVMGRNAGWVAAYGGLAGGADVILLPEAPFTVDEICDQIKLRHEQGKDFSIVVVAEGAKPGDLKAPVVQSTQVDEFGHPRPGGIGHVLAQELEDCTGYETRVTTLGHLQRGGSPLALDRIIATRMGVKAVAMVKDKKFGKMIVWRDDQLMEITLEEGLEGTRPLDMEFYSLTQIFK